MTPSQAIGMLDRQIAKHGENVGWAVTTAGLAGTPTTVRAFVRDFRPDQLVGAVIQGDTRVILSPTGLAGTIKKNDKIIIASRTRNVQFIEEKRLNNTLVRIELLVRG